MCQFNDLTPTIASKIFHVMLNFYVGKILLKPWKQVDS